MKSYNFGEIEEKLVELFGESKREEIRKAYNLFLQQEETIKDRLRPGEDYEWCVHTVDYLGRYLCCCPIWVITSHGRLWSLKYSLTKEDYDGFLKPLTKDTLRDTERIRNGERKRRRLDYFYSNPWFKRKSVLVQQLVAEYFLDHNDPVLGFDQTENRIDVGHKRDFDQKYGADDYERNEYNNNADNIEFQRGSDNTGIVVRLKNGHIEDLQNRSSVIVDGKTIMADVDPLFASVIKKMGQKDENGNHDKRRSLSYKIDENGEPKEITAKVYFNGMYSVDRLRKFKNGKKIAKEYVDLMSHFKGGAPQEYIDFVNEPEEVN